MWRIDLRIAPGEFVSIVGPSGCGKTTPLRLIAASRSRPMVREVGGSRVWSPSATRRARVEELLALVGWRYGALDALTRERLQVDLLKLWRASGKTIVFITHSVEEAVFLSTRVLVMSPRPGRVVIDRQIVLPGDGPDTVRDIAVTSTPQFQAVRAELAEAIYAAHD